MFARSAPTRQPITETRAIKLRIFDFDNTITKEDGVKFTKHIYKKIKKTIEEKTGLSIPLGEIIDRGLKSYHQYGHSAIGLAAHYNIPIEELYEGYHFKKRPGINECNREHSNNLKSFCAHALAIGEQVRNCILTHSNMDWTTRSLKFLAKQKSVKKLKEVFSEKVGNIFTAEQYRLADRLGNVTQFFKASSFIPYWLACVRMNVDPRDCSMTEDSLRNLAIAKQLGMQTIYIHHGKPLDRLPAYVDYQIESLAEMESIPTTHNVRADDSFKQFIDTEFAKAKAFFSPQNKVRQTSDWEFAEPMVA